MGLRPIVRLGDKTSHGGTVLEGFSTYSVYGKPASGLGHMVSCPLCKGSFPIVEGASTFTVNGIAVAVQGMRTGCGARLIASQNDATLDCGGGDEYATSGGDGASAAQPPTENTISATHDQHFLLVNEQTGQPLEHVRYKIFTEDGQSREGVTDENGKTEKISGNSAINVKIEVHL